MIVLLAAGETHPVFALQDHQLTNYQLSINSTIWDVEVVDQAAPPVDVKATEVAQAEVATA